MIFVWRRVVATRMWLRRTCEEKAGPTYTLMPHQDAGVKWMLGLESSGTGGLLFDEMGTGKTLQLIDLCCAAPCPTLIVVPLILLEQWWVLLQRHVPVDGPLLMRYHGTKSVFGARLRKLPLQDPCIVLTTYDMFAEDNNVVSEYDWSRAIFDEAHHMRNKNKRHAFAYELKCKVKWLVSGTPVQNKESELINLCRVAHLDAGYRRNSQLFLKKFVLRRTCQELGLALPAIAQHDHVVPWTNDEERRMVGDLHLSAQCAEHGRKLSLITQAKKACSIPATVAPFVPGMQARGELPSYKDYGEGLAQCSKVDYVTETVLAGVDAGNAIVFCQLLAEIDMLVARLSPSVRVGRFSGKNTMEERLRVLSTCPQVLVCQIDTAAEGLNMQEHFSQVYFVSPHWNPCLQDQAIGRVQRIGQTRQVFVHTFRMAPVNNEITSMDVIVCRAQKRKRVLAGEVVGARPQPDSATGQAPRTKVPFNVRPEPGDDSC